MKDDTLQKIPGPQSRDFFVKNDSARCWPFLHSFYPSYSGFHPFPTFLDTIFTTSTQDESSYHANTLAMNRYLQMTSGADQRLVEIFGIEQCQRWEKECPDYLAYQNFELASGHYIESVENIDVSQTHFELLESLDPVNFPIDEPEYFQSERFNPLRYNLHRSYLHRKHYLIGKTSTVLVLYSGEELRRRFNDAA